MQNTVVLKIKNLLSIWLYLAVMAALFFVGNMKVWICVVIVTEAVMLLLSIKEQRTFPEIGLTAGALVFQALWLILGRYVLYLLGIYLALADAVYLVIRGNIRKYRDYFEHKSVHGVFSKIFWLLSETVLGISLVVQLFLAITALTSVPMIVFMQKNMMHAANSYEANATEESETEIGTCISDVCYGTDYPNSYLDIYLTENKSGKEPATYFFIHGGGYCWGDKKEGDPNGGDTGEGGLAWYIKQFVDAGYNVITPNYALAPEYGFPVPVKQLSQALYFLKEHQNEYGIDMSRVIIGGNSGGGQLTGILASIQTNEDYSEEIGIEGVLDPDTVKAAVFSSALIDNDRSYSTGDPGADYLFLQCGKAYYGYDLLDGKTDIVSILNNITESFPPSFISDGNTGTFYEQAFDLKNKMDELGIRNELSWYSKEEAPLGHDFETRGSEYSIDTVNKILVFLEEVV